MRWLAMGTYDTRVHPRVGVLVQGLAGRGEEVAELVEPLGLATAERVALVRQPWRLVPALARLAARWLRLTRRAWPVLRGEQAPDALLVGYLGHVDVLVARALATAARRRPRPVVVLDHLVSAAGTAADRGIASRGGARDRALRWLDSAATRAADLVVLDTDERVAQLPEPARGKAVVAWVGATEEWFAAGAGHVVAQDGPLSVVFVGLFTPLQGSTVIAAALARLAGPLEQGRLRATLVGRGQDHAQARRLAGDLAGVSWVDSVPAGDLPAFHAAYDVGLGIFGTTRKGLTVAPNKVFQAAAAGCAVVTGDTAPQRRALGDAAVYVPPGDPDALAAALGDLADDRARAVDLARRARARAEQAFTPQVVVTPVLDRALALVEERRR